MSATLHPFLNKNTIFHRNSLGYSRVIFSSVFPHLVRIASGRSWERALRCYLHNPAPQLTEQKNPKCLRSLQTRSARQRIWL